MAEDSSALAHSERRAPASASGRGLSSLDKVVLAVLLMVLGVLYAWRHPPQIAYGSDTTLYLAGAKSLAEEGGYRFAFHEGTPRLTLYPPLQSAYLSLFWRLGSGFPDNVPWLNLGMLVLGLAASGMLFVYWRQAGLPLGLTVWLTLLWGVSENWYVLLAMLYSDVGFGVLWLALALVWQQWWGRGNAGAWILAGLLAAGLFLARSAAAGPLLAMLVFLVLQVRRLGGRPLLLFAAPLLAAVISWKTWSGNSVDYLDIFRSRLWHEGGLAQYAHLCTAHFAQYFSGDALSQAMLSGFIWLQNEAWHAGIVPGSAVLGITMGLCWLGWFLVARGVARSTSPRDRILAWSMAAYLIQLVLWPYPLGSRGLYPILPFVVVWLWRGLRDLPWPSLAKRLAAWVAVGILALSLPVSARLFWEQKTRLREAGHLEELREMSEWINVHLPSESRLAVFWALPVVHLHAWTGRMLVEDYFAAEYEASPLARSAQGHVAADYLLISDRSVYWERLQAAATDYPGLFQLVQETGRGRYRLYRIDPEMQQRFLAGRAGSRAVR